jgi:hypothetical protein
MLLCEHLPSHPSERREAWAPERKEAYIFWRTLGRSLLSRVPLPAAMMAMAKAGVVIDLYGLMFGFVLSYRSKRLLAHNR